MNKAVFSGFIAVMFVLMFVSNAQAQQSQCEQAGGYCIPVYPGSECGDGYVPDQSHACSGFGGSCCMPDSCGNNIVDQGEECDGNNLGGATCQSFGYDAGTLVCTNFCTFSMWGCYNNPTCGNEISEVGVLVDELDVLQYEDIKLTYRINAVQAKFQYVQDKVIFAKNTANKIIEARNMIREVDRIANVFSPLPYVGEVARTANSALNPIRQPIENAYGKAVRVKSEMEALETKLNNARKPFDYAEVKLFELGVIRAKTYDVFCFAEDCADEYLVSNAANLAISAARRTTDTIAVANQVCDDAEKRLDERLDEMTITLNKIPVDITNCLDLIIGEINKVIGPMRDLLNELNSCESISYLGVDLGEFCVIDVLEKGGSVVRVVRDWALDLIEPLIGYINDLFGIFSIPTLPSLGFLDDLLLLPELPTFDFSIEIYLEDSYYSDLLESCIRPTSL